MASLDALPEPVLLSILCALTGRLSPRRRVRALLTTSLISRSFLKPSRQLLFSSLEFIYLKGDFKLRKLLAVEGLLPELWMAQRLAFSAVDGALVGKCLGRAHKVEELRLEYVQGGLPKDFFDVESIRALTTLDLGPGVHFLPRTTFPTQLKSLHLSAPQPAPPLLQTLFRSNAPTLRSLHVLLSNATALNQLLEALPLIAPTLTSLSIVNGWLFDGDPIPRPLGELLQSCERLEHLRLEGFSLPQLGPLLECVSVQLETLTMEDIVGDGEGGWRKAGREIAGHLTECAQVEALANLTEWRLRVPELREKWRSSTEWSGCERALQERGTRLVWVE